MSQDPTPSGTADNSQFSYRSVVDPDLYDTERRLANGLPPQDDVPAPVIVELNLGHRVGVGGAQEGFLTDFARTVASAARRTPFEISTGYWRCTLSLAEIEQLVVSDRQRPASDRSISYIWTDFAVTPMIDMSARVMKATAAHRLFNADGRGIVWGVIDSGIAAQHPHFRTHDTLGGDEIAALHRDFSNPESPEDVDGLPGDGYGHGTHVAGIIAGGLPPADAAGAPRVVVAEHVSLSARLAPEGGTPSLTSLQTADPGLRRVSEAEDVEERRVPRAEELSGIAPRCKLISLRVLNDRGEGRISSVIQALRHVRDHINKDELRVHGINLSLGYDYNAKAFTCGQTPVCVEVNRLVRSGVVVVVAAGNSGFGRITAGGGPRYAAVTGTINDPGNAELAITVGSTHRSRPYIHGVSYFSSKGPTVDGRLKPDLVAPGERVTSCAAGSRALIAAAISPQSDLDAVEVALYIDDSGTSVAAPHVSGAIAAFLSVRREFIGQPERVKAIFLASALSLGRERYFEGHGLANLLGALQSV